MLLHESLKISKIWTKIRLMWKLLQGIKNSLILLFSTNHKITLKVGMVDKICNPAACTNTTRLKGTGFYWKYTYFLSF